MHTTAGGDPDLAALGEVLADRSRCRILLALGDGRALAASTLAAEAGVVASTASGHLARLVQAGLLDVEPHGRHRYYRLSGPDAARLLETLAGFAPTTPIRSLRAGSRAQALRAARTCYDHLAGRLGTDLMAALLDRGWLAGGDGRFDPGRADRDRPSAVGWDATYRLTSGGLSWAEAFGILVPTSTRRPLLRYCVDWSEQRHHLAGAFGAALLVRLVELGWLRRSPTSRAVHVTDPGGAGFRDTFGIAVPGPSQPLSRLLAHGGHR